MWKKSGESLSDRLVEGTLKYGGGSIIMWECITWDRPGYIIRINGRIDGDLYLIILKEELQQSLEFYGLDPSDIIF